MNVKELAQNIFNIFDSAVFMNDTNLVSTREYEFTTINVDTQLYRSAGCTKNRARRINNARFNKNAALISKHCGIIESRVFALGAQITR